MRIPKYIKELFNDIDHINHNGIIDQEEIDSFKGSGTVFDQNQPCYKLEAGMNIFKFIQGNESSFRATVQYTDNEYTLGRKIIDGDKFVPAQESRRKTSDDSASIQVEQGQYAIKKYSKKTPSMQVYGVYNCVAVTI